MTVRWDIEVGGVGVGGQGVAVAVCVWCSVTSDDLLLGRSADWKGRREGRRGGEGEREREKWNERRTEEDKE